MQTTFAQLAAESSKTIALLPQHEAAFEKIVHAVLFTIKNELQSVARFRVNAANSPTMNHKIGQERVGCPTVVPVSLLMRLSRMAFAAILFSLTPYAFAATPVVVHPDKAVRQIDPKFFGANVIGSVDDDAALKDGKIAAALKKIPVGLLRFPGGAVADNYYWESNTLDDPYSYPRRGGPGTTDFDHFMALTRQAGAEAVVIVNTESWVWHRNIAGGVKEAADWVRYCKTKGYRVRYWEIGNETYLHTAMTAREYAELVNRYVTAMKAVDPTIQIGANGSWNPCGVGRKDQLSDQERAMFDKLQGSGQPIHKIREIAKEAEKSPRNKRNPPPANAEEWWPTLVRICGGHIDFLIVHDYFYRQQMISELPGHLEAIRAEFKKHHPDKTYPILMSEYNVGRNTEASKQPMAFFDIEGAMLTGGVDWSCFWPLDYVNIDWWTSLTLLDGKTKQPQVGYEIMCFLAQRLVGATLVKTDPNDFGAYAVRKEDQISVFVSGRTLKQPTTIEVRLQDAAVHTATVLDCSIADSGKLKTQQAPKTLHGNAIDVDLRPGQFAVINCQLSP
jgi:hypothetical protein